MNGCAKELWGIKYWVNLNTALDINEFIEGAMIE